MSVTVSKMFRLGSWANGKLALGLPLVTAAVMVLLGVLSMVLGDNPTSAVAGFFTENVVHQFVVGMTFLLVTFVAVRHQASLILSMGFSRGELLGGLARVALRNAALVMLLYSLMGAVEVLTHGYGIYWYVFSPDLDAWAFYQSEAHPEALLLGVLDAVRFCVVWFFLVLLAQGAGALLGFFSLRWGIYRTMGAGAAILAATLVLSRQFFGTLYLDLGLYRLVYTSYYNSDGVYEYYDYSYNPVLYDETSGVSAAVVYEGMVADAMLYTVAIFFALLVCALLVQLLSFLTARRLRFR